MGVHRPRRCLKQSASRANPGSSGSSDDRLLRINALPEGGLLRAWQDGPHYGALPALSSLRYVARRRTDCARCGSASGGAARAVPTTLPYCRLSAIPPSLSYPCLTRGPAYPSFLCILRSYVGLAHPRSSRDSAQRITEMPAAGWAYAPRASFLPADLVQGSAYADRLSSVVIARVRGVERRVWAQWGGAVGCRARQVEASAGDDEAKTLTGHMGLYPEARHMRLLHALDGRALEHPPQFPGTDDIHLSRCLRTDRTAVNVPCPRNWSVAWTPCERCKMSFDCGDEHWSVAWALHQAPCDDLPGTVSQCDKNLAMCADADYGAVLRTAQEKHLMWRIIKRQAVWSALMGRTWKEAHRTAFTILYALEHLNTSTAWTEKSELTINMIIASPLYFFDAGYMYEAILHRAPRVKKVTVGTTAIFYECRLIFIHGKPSTFAEGLAESGQVIMRECGAEFVPSLSGVRNPFGDMKMSPNFDTVHWFHAPNASFVGGLR
ncbi:hypothetical protein C8J57DRAFT_1222947 [Mycena rebaudengoi]|nr:hypothetical protein C8J57DRAFT_1222947 [Mycena rebaudengoi]